MTDKNTEKKGLSTGDGIAVSCLDLSFLVGRDIVLFPEQYPDKRITSRVTMVNMNQMSIDRGRSSNLVEGLINGQNIVLQFSYRGEQASVNATLHKSPGGKCDLILEDKIIPLTRRRYRRFELERQAKLAMFPATSFDPKCIPKLRWRKTKTINVSCGGVMLDFAGLLEQSTYLFINLAMQEFLLPRLVIAQVRHCNTGENKRSRIGLEFITRDDKQRHFNAATLKRLPEAVLEFSASTRTSVNKKLTAWMRQENNM